MPNNTRNDAILQTAKRLKDAQGEIVDLKTKEYLTKGYGDTIYAPIPVENTWSAVLSDAASGGNVATIGTNYASYIKIGKLVMASFRLLSITTAGMTAGNTLQLQGLPFLSFNNSNYRATGTVRLDNVAFTGYVMVIMSGNVTNASFVEHTSGAAANFIIVSDLTSGTASLTGQITYIAES